MVGAINVASDVIENFAFFLLPAGLWLIMYLAAWSDDGLAKSGGFGRGTFWLLLPGCLLGSLGNLPFLSWGNDVLAVNIGGGLIPVALSVVLVWRSHTAAARSTAAFFGAFAGQSLVWFALVEAIALGSGPFRGASGTGLATALMVLVAATPAIVFAFVARGAAEPMAGAWNRAALLSALTAGVVLTTFATTEAVPNVGIISAFPEYLVAPLVVGAVAAILCARPNGGHPAEGLGVAYASTTFGVLIGADLLRQPPLYGGPTASLFAIGGAGVLDLLYLSGLLAVTVAYLTVRALLRERGEAVKTPAGPSASPIALLRQAWSLAYTGDPRPAVELSAQAATQAGAEAREMRGSLSGTDRTAWATLPVPVWAVQDYENLQALARQPTLEKTDGVRAWITGRGLVRMALDLGQARFARWTTRSKAFALDLLFVTLPSVAALALIIGLTPGTAQDLLAGIPVNAAALGIAAYGFVYFVVGETVTGRTLGKALLGLEVRGRRMTTVGLLPMFMRNVPKLIPLTALGIGLAEIMVLAFRGGSLLGPGNTTSLLLFITVNSLILGIGIVVVILLAGAASVVVITNSLENQRFGDYLAGTWVVHSFPVVKAPAPPVGAWHPRSG